MWIMCFVHVACARSRIPSMKCDAYHMNMCVYVCMYAFSKWNRHSNESINEIKMSLPNNLVILWGASCMCMYTANEWNSYGTNRATTTNKTQHTTSTWTHNNAKHRASTWSNSLIRGNSHTQEQCEHITVPNWNSADHRPEQTNRSGASRTWHVVPMRTNIITRYMTYSVKLDMTPTWANRLRHARGSTNVNTRNF